MRRKKTKIICTLGPASKTIETIEKLVKAGMDVARMNFSHGDHEFHKQVFENIREVEKRAQKPIGILADLQGPKIRTTKLKDGPFILKPKDKIWLNNNPKHVGDRDELGCTYPGIVRDLQIKDMLLLDDGKVRFRVLEKTTQGKIEKVLLQTLSGGAIKENKGINLPGTKINLPALSVKDRKDLKFAMELGVDYVALSFVRSAEDIKTIKKLLYSRKSPTYIGVIAKIERPEALDDIDNIIEISDGIMIARGDLGVEIATEKVPIIQKKLIKLTNLRGKVVITATHMMESMIENPSPTRAEATDIANAVLDSTDAVMLSGETAAGSYPVRAVSIMSKIIAEAENLFAPPHIKPGDIEQVQDELALGTAAVNIADSIGARVIINFTRSGASARLAAQFRPNTQIVSFTPYKITARKMSMLRGVIPHIVPQSITFPEMVSHANEILKKKYGFKKNDKTIILAASRGSRAYTTDIIQIYTII
ncbi:MAG: pyruvate kinase [Leptospirales bacterium]